MKNAGRREFLISKGWIQAVLLVVLFGFFVLGLLAYKNYTSHPPVPKQVVDANGKVLFTGSDISHGQQAFLNHGLMEYGSVLGHGAYLGPDYTVGKQIYAPVSFNPTSEWREGVYVFPLSEKAAVDHLTMHIGDRVIEGRTTGAVRVGPLLGHQAAVPAQDGGRGDQAMSAYHRRKVSDQRGEQGPVGPVQARPRIGSAQYGDLVAEDEQLKVFGRG